jgi:hypothetical protein
MIFVSVTVTFEARSREHVSCAWPVLENACTSSIGSIWTNADPAPPLGPTNALLLSVSDPAVSVHSTSVLVSECTSVFATIT